tara:strand:- start:842 stop:1726 length:885 start_codon:yes stop_codon:yes gene_type:complete
LNSRLDKHIYEKDKIVVGGNLSSLLYAYINELPVVFTELEKLFRLDFFDKDIDFEFMGLEPGVSYSYRQIQQNLLLLLGLSGNLPLSANAAGIRVQDKRIIVSTKRHRIIKMDFNSLVVFDGLGVSGLSEQTRQQKGKNRVIDWFNIRSGARISLDSIPGDGDFVNHLYFYPSDRQENKNLKDAVCVSYLTDEQMNNFDYSPTMARFKILKMMKEAGLRGKRNGRRADDPSKNNYYAIKIEAAERVVEPSLIKYYKPDPRFEYRYDTALELINQASRPSGYLGFLTENIWQRSI